MVSVESRVRKIEKNPSPKRLKVNVVTTDKLGFRAVTTKTVAPDAITPNEAAFGTTVVTDTQPTEYLKEGLTWVSPTDGATNVYSETLNDFVTVTDAEAVTIAQGKSKTYVQDAEPTGGTYSLGDLWIDTNDGNKLYAYTGSAWAVKQDGAISTAQTTANGKNKVNYSTSDPGSTANTAGDIWWKYSSGVVIAQWTGAGGTTWTSNTIGNTVIASLDAGKITTGFLSVAGSVKIGTDSGGSGTSARVEINSNGFYAYDGSVATVSITNTGTAVFSGKITSTDGLIGGWTINSGTIEKTHYGVTIELDSANGYIAVADGTNTAGIDTPSATGGTVFWAGPKPASGNGPGASPVFSVKTTGELNATNAYITGTITSGTISTNNVTSYSSVSTSNPRVTLASQALGQEGSGIGIIIDTGAGTVPGGIAASANLAGTSSNLALYGQVHGSNGGRGVLSLQSSSTASGGYAILGVSSYDSSVRNNIAITSSDAVLEKGSTYSIYALRNIKCVSSFSSGSDTTGTNGDVVLVYTP